jgi:IclR family acetate operon transcriptional repressor
VKAFFITGAALVADSQKNGSAKVRRARGRPRDWHDKTAQNTIKSLDRAMAVLEYLSQSQGLPLTRIAADMKLSPATVYRILVTLEGRGLVECDSDDQVWNIGPGAFAIGARFLRRTSLVDRARPIMRRLMETTGETANLGVEKEGSVLFLSQVETHAAIRAFFPPGTLSPLHASGIGKALLAEMDDIWIKSFLSSGPLEKYSDKTITQADELLRELQNIRERGYSFDNEERNVGMRCVAASVYGTNGEAVAGISVSGPTSRISASSIESLSSAVIDAAHNLTLAIGGIRSQGREPAVETRTGTDN